MYRVQGGDQKEYGPVGAETVRQWIQEGRLNRDSRIRNEGDAEWKPLSQFPEFAGLLALGTPPGPAETRDIPAAVPGRGIPMADPVRAADLVRLPAQLMVIMAGLGMVLVLVMLAARGAMLEWALNGGLPLDPGSRSQLEQLRNAGIGVTDILQALFGVAVNGMVIFGALKMQRLEDWGLAVTAAVLTLLPCAGCCCLIGLPIGVWSLLVLNKPEVKSAFR